MPRLPSLRLRFALASVALATLAVVAASCVEAVGADGYVDALGDACALANRCYGPAFTKCDERVGRIEQSTATSDWLTLVGANNCLDDCGSLFRCLDYSPICADFAPGVSCSINEDCCGFSSGATVCADDTCCRPLGAGCEQDLDCCPNTGFCDADTGTCGGVVCAEAGAACVNDFLCCTGRCSDDGLCEDAPCPPEGFACESDADCCALLCDPATKRCTDPSCSLLGESCESPADCCDDSLVCNTQGGMGGVCSSGQCNPDNSDCLNDGACCSGHCIAPYNLCGQCVDDGAPCSEGVPCCGGLTCTKPSGDTSGTCSPTPK